MSSAFPARMAPEEYLARERAAETKSDYLNGFMYAMAGANTAHNLIAYNLSGVLGPQLRTRDCEAYIGHMRLCVDTTGLYTYPDLMILCGERKYLAGTDDTLTNPTIIIEILSSSTEAYDRGEKVAHYQRLESLQTYVLISQDRMRIETYRRQGDQWLLTVYRDPGDIVRFESIGCEVPIEEIYDRVLTTPNPPTPGA